MRATIHFSGLALMTVVVFSSPQGVFAGDGDKQGGKKGHGDRPSKEEVFKHIDANEDGKISAEEFMSHKPPHKPPEGAPPREEIFKKMDADGDGSLTLDEFKLPPPPGKNGKEGPPKGGGEGGGPKGKK